MDISVTFLSLDPIDIGDNPFEDLDGAPVLTEGRCAFQSLAGGLNQTAVLAESGFGAYALIETEELVRRAGQIGIFDDTFAARMQTRRFMHYLRGRDAEFWLPTDQSDLILNAPISAAGQTADVFPIINDADIVGRAAMFNNGGASVARTIGSAVTNSPTSQTIQFAALGEAMPVDAAVSTMTKMRLDTDEIVFSYEFTMSGLVSRLSAPTIEVL